MTQRPICPACRSDQITPDASNGGAGRNRCAVCGHAAAVREFYSDRPTTFVFASGEADPIKAEFRDRRFMIAPGGDYDPKDLLDQIPNINARYGKFYDPNLANSITEKAREITAEAYKTLYMQDPVMFPIPEGYHWDNKTGTIQPDKHKPHFWWQDQ